MTAPARDTAWMSRGACRGTDPDLFFPVGSVGPALTQIAQAKAICARCPVIGACLEWALGKPERSGVWGGTTGQERDAIRRYGSGEEAVRRAVLEREVRSFAAEHGSERRSRHRWQHAPAAESVQPGDPAPVLLPIPPVPAAEAAHNRSVLEAELKAAARPRGHGHAA